MTVSFLRVENKCGRKSSGLVKHGLLTMGERGVKCIHSVYKKDV